MFFTKFFTRDYRSYMDKGEKHFAEERYADARNAFLEALHKLEDSVGDSEAKAAIDRRIVDTGNRLGLLNLAEAEYAIARGEVAKAEEHLGLVLELAEDPVTRTKAENLVGSITSPAAPVQSPPTAHNCSGCSPQTGAISEEDHSHDHLSGEERFELLVQTLPEDLPQRYVALGGRFADAYLLVHDGEEKAGTAILEELLSEQDNDILLYELALISHRAGNAADCEAYFRRALTINGTNPLCCLGLVQLLADTGRLTECIPLLNSMIDREMLLEQAIIFLADVHQNLGNEEAAMGGYTKALAFPGAAKAAAERLVVLLQKQGRSEEAAYVAKKYLKGCC
ncbi:MAG: hypothetical protein EHM51_02370 [Geobacter sp.]|nr:MAG: hypothetical protein EHM51_02370 [Geobacter sp.]